MTTKMTKHLCLTLLLLSIIPLRAQITLRGIVLDSASRQGIALSSIALHPLEGDTTANVATYTDLQGGYLITGLRPGTKYSLLIHARGYLDLEQTYTTPQDSTTIERTFVLTPTAQELAAVEVTAEGRGHTAEMRSYTFSPKERKVALQAFDLLKGLPTLRIDPVTNSLRPAEGGSLVILINGIRATENDLRMIPTSKVQRVQLYDVPPIRYQDASCVINVVTSRLDDGYTGGFEYGQSPQVGFGDGNAYFTYTLGRHRLSLDYRLSYRNYRDRRGTSTYQYQLSGTDRSAQERSTDHFGYTSNSPRAKYAYIDNEKQVLEATLGAELLHRFSRGTNETTYRQRGLVEATSTGSNTTRSDIITPYLDLYYWRKFTSRSELSLNAVATHFVTSQDNKDSELSAGHKLFENILDLHSSKTSFIGEAEYIHSLSFARWSCGYRAEYASLLSNYTNQQGKTHYRSHYYTGYAYSQLTGRWRKLVYQLSLGLTHTRNRSEVNSYDQLLLTPRVVLGYRLGSSQSLRRTYTLRPVPPSVIDLSTNTQQTNRDIIFEGNPSLINEQRHHLQLIYSLQNKYIEIQGRPSYYYARNPIIQTYLSRGSHYLSKNINAPSYEELRGALGLTIMPLGNKNLALGIETEYHHGTLHTEGNRAVELDAFGLDLGLKASLGSFGLFYQYRIPSKYFSRGAKTLQENAHHAMVSYRLGLWSFSAALTFIGTPSHYEDWSLPYSPVTHHATTDIYANKNMIRLGVSYHFSKGKNKDYDRNLSNSDSAAPTL